MLRIFRYFVLLLPSFITLSCAEKNRTLTRISGEIRVVSDTSTNQPGLGSALSRYGAQYGSLARGSLTVAPFGIKSRPRSLQGALGNFVADAVKEEGNSWCQEQTERKLDLALLDKSVMYRELASGSISRRDLWEIYPDFGNLVLVEIQGLHLRNHLKSLVDQEEWFAISGARFLLGRESAFRFEIGGTPLSDQRVYLVLMDLRSFDLVTRPGNFIKIQAVVQSPLTVFDLLQRYCSNKSEIQSFNDNRIQISP